MFSQFLLWRFNSIYGGGGGGRGSLITSFFLPGRLTYLLEYPDICGECILFLWRIPSVHVEFFHICGEFDIFPL